MLSCSCCIVCVVLVSIIFFEKLPHVYCSNLTFTIDASDGEKGLSKVYHVAANTRKLSDTENGTLHNLQGSRKDVSRMIDVPPRGAKNMGGDNSLTESFPRDYAENVSSLNKPTHMKFNKIFKNPVQTTKELKKKIVPKLQRIGNTVVEKMKTFTNRNVDKSKPNSMCVAILKMNLSPEVSKPRHLRFLSPVLSDNENSLEGNGSSSLDASSSVNQNPKKSKSWFKKIGLGKKKKSKSSKQDSVYPLKEHDSSKHGLTTSTDLNVNDETRSNASQSVNPESSKDIEYPIEELPNKDSADRVSLNKSNSSVSTEENKEYESSSTASQSGHPEVTQKKKWHIFSGKNKKKNKQSNERASLAPSKEYDPDELSFTMSTGFNVNDETRSNASQSVDVKPKNENLKLRKGESSDVLNPSSKISKPFDALFSRIGRNKAGDKSKSSTNVSVNSSKKQGESGSDSSKKKIIPRVKDPKLSLKELLESKNFNGAKQLLQKNSFQFDVNDYPLHILASSPDTEVKYFSDADLDDVINIILRRGIHINKKYPGTLDTALDYAIAVKDKTKDAHARQIYNRLLLHGGKSKFAYLHAENEQYLDKIYETETAKELLDKHMISLKIPVTTKLKRFIDGCKPDKVWSKLSRNRTKDIRKTLDRLLSSSDSTRVAAKLHRFALRYKTIINLPTELAISNPLIYTLQERQFNKAFALLAANVELPKALIFSQQILCALSFSPLVFTGFQARQAFVLLKYLILRGFKFNPLRCNVEVPGRICLPSSPSGEQLSIILMVLAKVEEGVPS